MTNYNPVNDGIDHLNIYSKAKTDLGQFLSNFYNFYQETNHGFFCSLEGYWQFLKSRNDIFRNMKGLEAKEYSKKNKIKGTLSEEDQKHFKDACTCKLFANPYYLNQFISSKLNFTHYYVMNENVVDTPHTWLVSYWEGLRVTLQKIRSNVRSPQRMHYYAGVGSRKTPSNIMKIMTDIACKMNSYGYTLLSGGAKGADKAFEYGSKSSIIFRPENATNLSRAIAKSMYYSFDKFTDWQINKPYFSNLHGRNAFQILGPNLDILVDYVICWTPDACFHHDQRSIHTGGTGTAISIATKYAEYYFGIKSKIINLADTYTLEVWTNWVMTS